MRASGRYLLLCTLVLLSGFAAAAARAAQVHCFEDTVPGWASAPGGKLAISGDQYKDGRSSLKWTYGRGGRLVFTTDIGFKPFRPNAHDQKRWAFLGWIYGTQPHAGQYEFAFFAGTRRAASFAINADFSGWRALVVAFEEEMDGVATSDMDRLEVTAPPDAEGVAYFDQMVFGMPVDPRHPIPDYQVPYVNKSVRERPNEHWGALLQFDGWLRAADRRPARAAADAKTDRYTEQILSRLDEDLLQSSSSEPHPDLPRLREQYERLFLQPGKLKALSETSRQWDLYREGGVDGSQLEFLKQTTVRWADVGQLMLSLAIAHRQARDPRERADLEAMFLELTAHLINQGLVRGSGQGVMHHQGYVLAAWARALYLMRQSLGEYADEAREAIAWYAGLGRIYRPSGEIVDLNVDVMNTLLREMLFSILMETDAPRRRRLLADYSAWLSRSILTSHGLAGGIKSDGSVFHHSQHYVPYANGGLTGLTSVAYYLAGTSFGIEPEARRQVRRAVLMSRVYSNRGRFLMSLAGRHPNDHQYIVLAPFKYLTLAGDPDRPQAAFDEQMARAYLRLAQRGLPLPAMIANDDNARRYYKGYDAQLVDTLVRAGYSAEDDPNGSWVMNNAGLVLHRRGNDLIGARGFSRYLVGNEAYTGQNTFGRYLNYGHLEILPGDPERRGYRQAGWDWNRWPGTTTIHLPLERLRARLSQVDQFAGVEEMLLSDESFAGGVHLRGKNAMFAMKLHAHPKYPGDLRASKSVFFFDDRVVALGSTISSADPDHDVETTLFQDFIRHPQLATDIGGEKIAGQSFSWAQDSGPAQYIVDLNGNGFYVAAGQKLRFARRVQDSIEQDGSTASSGAFATLVIDHGKAPRDAAYEYAILLGSGTSGARDFAQAMTSSATAPYRVLEKNDRAHVVFDRATGITSYALFAAGELSVPGTLVAVSSPSMVMLREDGSVLEAAYVDPDLHLYEGRDESQYDAAGRRMEVSVYSRPWRNAVAKDRVARLTFAGRWRVAKNEIYRVAAHAAGNTVVEVTSRPGDPVQLTLLREE